jgi:putative heme-binding domain-containing protein
VHRSPEEPARLAAVAWWSEWFAAEFGRAYVPKSGRTRPDEAVHKFLLDDKSRGGDAIRGGAIYERLACHTCHGGGAAPGREGRLFGPDLAGVTRRLTRAEFADALVYPSKQVADRFKLVQLEKKDGTVLAGFITEKTAEAITFADMAQIYRIPPAEIARLAPQTNSVMPSGLLSTLSDEEIRDLLAFLENIGVAGGK